jgi:hypothetical protein
MSRQAVARKFIAEFDSTETSIAELFVEITSRTTDLGRVIEIYKEFANRPDGYLHTPVFERFRDGKDDAVVRRFFASPFADVRIWLPEMFGIFVSRFPDHPQTYIVVDNLSDEYGKYLGRHNIEPSHATLYRRVLEELEVPVREGTMTTPARPTSRAAASFYKWFKERVEKESPDYLIGHFLAYEITDVLDFPDYTTAAKRIWPGRSDLHEFFTQHADSEHDAAFARDLLPFFAKNRKTMISAMGHLLENWTSFYRDASAETKKP